jgi:hypothetical protein
VPEGSYDPDYHEWVDGRFEQCLPEKRTDVNANNRQKRVERLALHIECRADRSLCRQFVYTEEEWRSGCQMAGRGEPGEGWVTQPATKGQPPTDFRQIKVIPDELF